MSLPLSIGGLDFRVEAPLPVLDRVAERYGGFAVTATRPGARRPVGPPVVIQLREETGGGNSGGSSARADGSSLLPPDEIALSPGTHGSVEVILSGGTRGRYDPAARRGFVEDDIGYGPFDALVRVALSTALPLEGSLLLHAAALLRGNGDSVALCGDSGAGKSTAAASMGAACDELAVIRLASGGGVELLSTPFWRGHPYRGRCSAVYGLSRSREGRVRMLRGAAAVRGLARHVVRYVPHPRIERATFEVIAGVCDRIPIREAACPEGEAYLPFLAAELGERETS